MHAPFDHKGHFYWDSQIVHNLHTSFIHIFTLFKISELMFFLLTFITLWSGLLKNTSFTLLVNGIAWYWATVWWINVFLFASPRIRCSHFTNHTIDRNTMRTIWIFIFLTCLTIILELKSSTTAKWCLQNTVALTRHLYGEIVDRMNAVDWINCIS